MIMTMMTPESFKSTSHTSYALCNKSFGPIVSHIFKVTANKTRKFPNVAMLVYLIKTKFGIFVEDLTYIIHTKLKKNKQKKTFRPVSLRRRFKIFPQ
jgi:hypothetical protein